MKSHAHRSRRLAHALLGTLLVTACRGGESPADTTDAASDTAAMLEPRQAPSLTATGIGPVQIGTTLDSARQALGEQGAASDSLVAACDYVRLGGLPQGVALMIVEGRVVRIDVQAPGITTDKGARVGDTESRIDSLYGPAVRREPHKYVDGSYLIVPLASDTTRQVVFETDGRVVTTFRAGMLPMVRWVEGCS